MIVMGTIIGIILCVLVVFHGIFSHILLEDVSDISKANHEQLKQIRVALEEWRQEWRGR